MRHHPDGMSLITPDPGLLSCFSLIGLVSIMDEREQRFLEAEFILICHDLYKIKCNIYDVYHFAEAVCQMDTFSELRIKKLIQLVFAGGTLQPTKTQWVQLLLLQNIPIKDITRITNYTRQSIYNLKETEIILPRHFLNNLTEKDYLTLQRFMNLVKEIRQIGVSNERPKEKAII